MTVNKIFSFSFFILGIIFSSSLNAGPWISSGGDLLGNSLNPWFLPNTPIVQYCFRVDTQSYSASLNETRVAFNKALNFWRTEFAEHGNSPGALTLPLFIPQFVEVACRGTEAFTVVLGEGALHAPEAAYVKSLKRDVVGLTVRTSYDPVNLKGQGFLFISGDKTKTSWVKDSWRQTNRLALVLAHELGHVFGVPHLSGDANVVTGVEGIPLAFNLMSEKLPEAAVLASRDSTFQFAMGIMPVLSSLRFHTSCDIGTQAFEWFKLSADTKCLQTMLFDLHGSSEIFAEIYSFNEKQVPTLVGQLKDPKKNQVLLGSKFEVITQAVISPEQKVFNIPQNHFLANETLPGGTQVYATLHLQFVPAQSPLATRPVVVTLSPAQLIILGISQNDFVSVFSSQRIRPKF